MQRVPKLNDSSHIAKRKSITRRFIQLLDEFLFISFVRQPRRRAKTIHKTMAKRAAKSDNSTSSPDPAPAKSSATTPAKSSTPAKTPKSAKDSKDSKDKDAAAGAAGAATPTAGTTKPRRQTKPRVSSAAAGGSGSGSGADKHGGALLAGLHPVVKVAAVEVLALGLITAGHVAVATMSHNEMGGLKALGQTTEELVWQVGWRA